MAVPARRRKDNQASHDEGIDGVINEIALVWMSFMCKRRQNTVGRKEIQSFVGALAGNRLIREFLLRRVILRIQRELTPVTFRKKSS